MPTIYPDDELIIIFLDLGEQHCEGVWSLNDIEILRYQWAGVRIDTIVLFACLSKYQNFSSDSRLSYDLQILRAGLEHPLVESQCLAKPIILFRGQTPPRPHRLTDWRFNIYIRLSEA